ncbi:hypothetical protein J7J45_04740 [Candidatus Aerophobetes bacterium]|nr:hypothetical protein [Candidatus Aerophobetes bacterium]
MFGEHCAVITEEMDRVVYSSGLKKKIISEDYSQLPISVKWGYTKEDKLFIDAILNKRKSPVSAEEGYKAVELTEACYRSAKEGKRINLPL